MNEKVIKIPCLLILLGGELHWEAKDKTNIYKERMKS